MPPYYHAAVLSDREDSGLGELRIMGILQRISLCYPAATLLVLYARPQARMYWES